MKADWITTCRRLVPEPNPECPIYGELLGIVRKTFGSGEQLRTVLAPLTGKLVWAFVYGSIAKGSDHAGSDIDLMLIGKDLGYGEMVERLLPVEERLGRSINHDLYAGRLAGKMGRRQ